MAGLNDKMNKNKKKDKKDEGGGFLSAIKEQFGARYKKLSAGGKKKDKGAY